ncbi:Asp23/Gls24 family envelope stress response protein [Prauserella oleivorans]|uniref:Asp23/Gls24 family envelope stress response protein n=1 Tax=Prauserella oleivorans TaxID=1478153 RepID=A0ABW5WAV2_9PSEU
MSAGTEVEGAKRGELDIAERGELPTAGHADREVAERGKLEISHGVVRKVAARAADETGVTARAPRRVAGLDVGHGGPTVRVAGADNAVDLRLDVALHYPAPVRPAVERIRESVIERVEHITSYRVRTLEITVSALVPETRARVR